MQENLHEAADKAIGGAATLLGSAGITVQWLTGFGNLVLIGINILLAIGGLYLLWLRVRRARKEK